MSNTPPDNAVEQRRKVLKGALAASGVVTMGYSGSALASFNCLERTTLEAPFNGGQLVETIPEAYVDWTWKRIVVSTDGNGDGEHLGWFTHSDQKYKVTLNKGQNAWTAKDNPLHAGLSTPPDNAKQVDMYLLVLYGPSGTGYGPVTPSPYLAGPAADPGLKLAAQVPQPITDSCHTSLNPGTTGSGLRGG